jgi:hypothetical protein
MLAGGGIKRGAVYGLSDSLAAEPEENPVSPEDLAATVYQNVLDLNLRAAIGMRMRVCPTLYQNVECHRLNS